jgi:hypothetical protein
MQFDLGRVQTHDLAADASEPRQIALSARAAAIHHESRIGERAICDESLPMTLDARFFESDGDRLQEFAIVDLRFISDV